MNSPDAPRRLGRQWTALLLAPVAWVTALGILFPLTHDACTRNTRTAQWVVLAVCILLAVLGALLARREIGGMQGNAGWDRARFLMQAALGLSATFVLVLLVMAAPILMLGACRT